MEIFAVSEELATRISSRARVVPNGVDPEVWRPHYPGPATVSELPGPRAIYTGTIDNRLDRRLVELTAERVGSLIMIGHRPEQSVNGWLRSIENVHMFDSVAQVELAATVQACDLGIIPHCDEAGIRAMSPLKLYEYLAAGLPVIAVDFPPMHEVDDERVQLCRPEDWVEALAETLRVGRAPEHERLRFTTESHGHGECKAWSMQPFRRSLESLAGPSVDRPRTSEPSRRPDPDN